LAVRTSPFHGGNRGSIPRGRASFQKKTQSVSDCVFLLHLLFVFKGRLKLTATQEAEVCKINRPDFLSSICAFQSHFTIANPRVIDNSIHLKSS
ncbi:hypothetical protein ACTHSZ_23815, partial [Neisseria sp. P0006.S006]